jgi:hypothetical protein
MNDIKLCKKCGIKRCNLDFRKKKSRGNIYLVNICIFCERESKRFSERLRYSKFSKEQKESNNRRSAEYRKRERYKIWHRKWQREREVSDIHFKLKRRVSALMRNTLMKNGKAFEDIVGYTCLELKDHIESKFESWMKWDNWGVYDPKTWDDNDQSTWKWQIDHIIPINNFKYISIYDEDFKKCWSLNNLRPLSAKANLLKGNKV